MDKVILAGPYIGELGWEILRFTPHVLYKKENYKLIVCTREDRYDLYGKNCHEFIPLDIEGDYTIYKGDCFKLIDYPEEDYYNLADRINKEISEKYKIVKHIFPDIRIGSYNKKDLYHENEKVYKFEPRPENRRLVDEYINNGKKTITISPRFREGIKRNWPHWNEFFDLIHNSELFDKFNFVICGKRPEYVSDEKNRFYDINDIKQSNKTSLIGLTIEIINKSILTIGSQSGLPNLSNLLGTPTLQFGNEKWQHEKTYNINRTKTTFIPDTKYSIKPENLFKHLIKALKIENHI